MANQYGFDLGAAFSTAENIKGSRTQCNALALQEEERIVTERPAREKAAAERNAMLTGLRGKAAAGDQEATQQLLSVDPEGGAKFIEAVGKMNQQQIDAAKRNVDEMGKLSSYVLNGDGLEEQTRRYNLMYQGLSEEIKAKMPEQYDPNFMSMSLIRAQSMDKILENPEVVSMGTEDVLYKGGQEVGRADQPADITSVRSGEEDVTYSNGIEIDRGTRAPTGSGGGSGGSDSSDESLMYRMAGGLLGGTFDEQGNLIALDPEARNKVQAITTEATKIFKAGNVTRAQAVKMAANKFGVTVQTPEELEASKANSDPDGIRNYFLNQ